MRNRSIMILGLLLLAAMPLRAQFLGDERRAPSFDGTPGLFRTWDAEPIRQGEVFVSTGVVRTNRDPGELAITTAPGGLAIGLFDRLEVFATWEVQKRIQADGIQIHRVAPGQPSRLTTTRTGRQLATSAAPFMDVPVSRGRGELYGRVKLNLFSENAGRPAALSVVATGKIPRGRTFADLNTGLTTGDTEAGFGVLVSKRLTGGTQLHWNTLVVITAHPAFGDVDVSDLQNRFVNRGGLAFSLARSFQGIAELEVTDYFFHQNVEGFNPTKPVDLFLGVRAFPGNAISISAGYTALVNRIEAEPASAVRPASPHGFVVQLGVAMRRN